MEPPGERHGSPGGDQIMRWIPTQN